MRGKKKRSLENSNSGKLDCRRVYADGRMPEQRSHVSDGRDEKILVATLLEYRGNSQQRCVSNSVDFDSYCFFLISACCVWPPRCVSHAQTKQEMKVDQKERKKEEWKLVGLLLSSPLYSSPLFVLHQHI